jgi:tRNA 5-methylaminomethyl-2-thiouridine biosynthesis bifunctional protein
VYHCESQLRDASRFDRLADQPVFAEGALTRFGPGSIDDLPDAGGLIMRDALTVEPSRLLAGLLANAMLITDRVTQVGCQDDRVSLRTASGGQHIYDAAIVACGDGVFDLEGLMADHDLRPVRGQVETVRSEMRPARAVSWGGYLAPSRQGFLFGATHDRDDRDSAPRAADRHRNLETLKARLPHMADAVVDQDIRSRASVRVTTRDHLPLAGELAPGLYALTGLGARGFCLAPLLARDIVAQITGAPSCLPQAVRQRLRSKRLQRTYTS